MPKKTPSADPVVPKPPATQVGTRELALKLEELIIEKIVVKGQTGQWKMQEVVDAAADWLEEHAEEGFLGPLAIAASGADRERFGHLCQVAGQLVYDRLKDDGRV